MEDIFGDELYGVGNDNENRAVKEDDDDGDIEDHEDNGRADSAEEAEEEKKRIVKPKKVVLHPRPKLDPQRLTGPRGIGVLESVFKDFKFKGKGHEVEDLNRVMQQLEHWAHRLFPKMTFDDCLDKIEDLGSKKPVMTYLTKLRLGMEDVTVQYERPASPEDPFDRLVTTTPPQPPPQKTLTSEQRARMMRNRLIAEERRLARMKAMQEKKLQENEAAIEIPDENHPISIS